MFCFPPEHKTQEGQLFWTNPKRPPTPIEFDENDDIHMQFVQSTVNIFAEIFSLKKIDDVNEIKKELKNVKVE